MRVIDIPNQPIPSEPGAYIIATRIPINRAIGTDKQGNLDIGESNNLKRRLSDFYGCATGTRKKGHRAGWRYYYLKLDKAFPLGELWLKWTTTDSKESAYQIEGKLLQSYLKKHGELPPLNYQYNWTEGRP